MKKRFAFNKHFRGRELLITAQRGEDLNTRRAKWLSEAHDASLLRFSYDEAHGTPSLHYDVGGLVSLKSFLKRRVLDDAEFIRLMLSVQAILDLCSSQRVPTELILFDPSDVFVDDQAQPRFVVTPLDNVPYALGNSPLAMLRALGNPRRLSFVSPSTEMLSSKLEAFVLNQNNVFSGNAFRAFLRDQCDIDIGRGAAPRRLASSDARARERRVQPVEATELRMWNGIDGQTRGGNARTALRATCVMERLSTGETYPLVEGGRVGIGRGSRNEVRVLGNPKLSRNHAAIEWRGDSVSLVDLESANGTWVQGRRLAPNKQVRIPIGQRFSLADEDFVVQRG